MCFCHLSIFFMIFLLEKTLIYFDNCLKLLLSTLVDLVWIYFQVCDPDIPENGIPG